MTGWPLLQIIPVPETPSWPFRFTVVALAFMPSTTCSLLRAVTSYLMRGHHAARVVWTRTWGFWGTELQGHWSSSSAGPRISISYPLLQCWAKLRVRFQNKVRFVLYIWVWVQSWIRMWDAMAWWTSRNSQVNMVINWEGGEGGKIVSSMDEQAESNFWVSISVLWSRVMIWARQFISHLLFVVFRSTWRIK